MNEFKSASIERDVSIACLAQWAVRKQPNAISLSVTDTAKQIGTFGAAVSKRIESLPSKNLFSRSIKYILRNSSGCTDSDANMAAGPAASESAGPSS